MPLVLSALPVEAVDTDTAKLFRSKCAPCHGRNVRGKRAAAKFLGVKRRDLNLRRLLRGWNSRKLLKSVLEGKETMPGFEGKLSRAEAVALLAHVKGLANGTIKPEKPKDAFVMPVPVPRGPPSPESRKLYKKKCSSCHGKDGKGKPKMTKALKTTLGALNLVDRKTRRLSSKQLYKEIALGRRKMPGYAKKLSAEEIAGLVGYIRSLAR